MKSILLTATLALGLSANAARTIFLTNPLNVVSRKQKMFVKLSSYQVPANLLKFFNMNATQFSTVEFGLLNECKKSFLT